MRALLCFLAVVVFGIPIAATGCGTESDAIQTLEPVTVQAPIDPAPARPQYADEEDILVGPGVFRLGDLRLLVDIPAGVSLQWVGIALVSPIGDEQTTITTALREIATDSYLLLDGVSGNETGRHIPDGAPAQQINDLFDQIAASIRQG